MYVLKNIIIYNIIIYNIIICNIVIYNIIIYNIDSTCNEHEAGQLHSLHLINSQK